MSEIRSPDRVESIIATVCLGLVLLFHGWGASVGWNSQSLPGCEFRQTQTALSAHFILREKNYSLAYPTPVLGKPWSIPMEFPLYQWTVAKVTELSGWPLTQVGRGVSLVCFYLTLPALYGLARCLGLPRARALLVLSFIVICPLYIFYARAFLIETMAWMFGSWFLLGYVMSAGQRRPAWLVVAAAGGVGAGLVKVTTLIAFLLPAFAWTLVWFWQDWRANSGAARWRAWRGRVAWCAAAVAWSLGAAWWWVRYSDRIKLQSPTGAFLESGNMAGYNFGVGVRFDPGVWDQHWHVIFNELAPIPILLVAGVVALCFARAHWWQIGLLVGFFFAVQLVFPILYAWHEYYYVAIAMLLMAAIGLAVCGLFESRVPRWAAWLVVVGLLLGQARAYYTRYYSPQREWSPGGSQLTVALKRVTEPDDVLVIAGDDWSSIIPYYSQRRALMIRRDLETTWEVIEPAFAALRGEPVAALILYGKQRENQALLDRAVRQFQLDPRPAFKWQEADVFLRRPSWSRDLDLLVGTPGIVLSAEYNPEAAVKQGREVDMTGWRPRHMTDFSMMSRWPWKYYSSYGLNRAQYKGRDYVSIHPDTRFWFKVPAGAHRLSVAIDFVADAYSEALVWPERSDGVEIVVTTQTAGAPGRVVGRRLVDPRANPGDRDRLVVDFDFVAEAAADLEFAVLPGPAGSYTRDWVLLETLTLE